MYASRREHIRIPSEVEVSVSSEHTFFTGWSENISEGGLFIATHQLLPIGAQVELTLTAEPHLPPTSVVCEVRWLRKTDELTSDCPPGMGLRFIGLSESDQQRIHQFLETQREALFVDI